MSSPTGTLLVAAPVLQAERIEIIDALRGFAILGILLMNIPGFSLPDPVGYDPSVLNEYGTINFKVWHFVEWFPEGTQRAIFSMLFGAGIILFTTRQEKKLDGVKPADYFIRRQLWLMVFGIIDVYLLLWWGDILFDYACYGLIMFAFRKMSPKALFIGSAVCLLLMIGRENRELYQDKKVIQKGELVQAIDTTKVKLTALQIADLSAMNDFKEISSPEKKAKKLESSIRKTTSSYGELYEYRTDVYVHHLVKYLYMQAWDVLVFMFLGMALFKTGVLTGQVSSKIYWIMAILGLGLGLTVSYLRMQPEIQYKFNWFEIAKHTQFEKYTLSRFLRSIGIFASIMLLYKSGWFKWLFALMRPVGQMAFSNYLTQSLICGLIFYGIGFGEYGKLQRVQVYYIVGVIWIVQIIWSNIWLRYFYFGPFEWCWRSLTYWKKQPFKKSY
ncbi:MAG: DUF418 domain-containing protein [Chitinophagaceae bacterium]